MRIVSTIIVSAIKEFSSDRRGTTAIVFAMLAALVFGISGLALDYNRGTRLKSEMQAALDASVLAAMQAEPRDRAKMAEEHFLANLHGSAAPRISLNFSEPATNQIKGVATTAIDTMLARILGTKKLTITTEATAAADATSKVCILVLDPSATQALFVSSGANVSAPDCEVHVKSTGANAAVFNGGTAINSKRLCIASSRILDNGGAHPNMSTSCPAADDPYVGRFATPANAVCDYNNMNYASGSVTLSPGVYCGWTNFNGGPTVTLQPGVYVVKGGGWNVNGGTWTGNGVTFYFADQSKIQFNSAVAANITAPTSGPYQDVVMFEDDGLARSAFIFNDARAMKLTGLIYLPSRDTIFNGGSSVTSRDTTLVVNTLILDQTNWDLESSSTEIGSGGGHTMARLVQ
jgi:Flp pilus assembly protein TadG